MGDSPKVAGDLPGHPRQESCGKGVGAMPESRLPLQPLPMGFWSPLLLRGFVQPVALFKVQRRVAEPPPINGSACCYNYSAQKFIPRFQQARLAGSAPGVAGRRGVCSV